ncbi:unnamed protein product [Auanema sp. JU1783]|nr:unnamed protein product [Auanema sp. JU1783]
MVPLPDIVDMNNGSIKSGFSDDAIPSTSTSFATDDYIRRAAESVGMGSLNPNAITATSNNVMYVLRHIISNSVKFANHARRKRVLAEDIDAAMQIDRRPPQFGFKTREHLPIRLVGSGGREVFVDEDKEVELAPIYTAPPPKIYSHATIRAHWLAIDGEQPAVPENPVPIDKPSEGNDRDAQTEEQTQDDSSRLLLMKGSKKSEHVNIRTTATHVLSLEQQVFFKEITEAIMGTDDLKRTEALHSLKTDAGLQPLIGRFSITVTEGVKCNIVQHNLAFLIYLMRLVQSLCANPHVSLEKYLHELLPSILSCVLSRQLCSRPDSENHWALREFASRLLADLCRKYHTLELQSRITKVLTKVWANENSSIATLYGSLFALNELGTETIRAVVVPRTSLLYERLRVCVNDRTNLNDKIAAERFMSFMTKVLINYVRTQRPTSLREFSDYANMFGGFADSVYRVVATDVPSSTRLGATPIRAKHITAPPAAQSSPRISSQLSTPPVSQQRMVQRSVHMNQTTPQQRQTTAAMTPNSQQQVRYNSTSHMIRRPGYSGNQAPQPPSGQ